jgi:hypothetical protein
MYRSLDLIENKHRRPAMMMDRFFVFWFQGHFEHPQALVLEYNPMMFGCSGNRIQCGIPL